MTKMTKKDWFAMVIAVVENAEVENRAEMLEFLNHEVDLLAKKSSKSGETKSLLTSCSPHWLKCLSL